MFAVYITTRRSSLLTRAIDVIKSSLSRSSAHAILLLYIMLYALDDNENIIKSSESVDSVSRILFNRALTSVHVLHLPSLRSYSIIILWRSKIPLPCGSHIRISDHTDNVFRCLYYIRTRLADLRFLCVSRVSILCTRCLRIIMCVILCT